jgi:hypothetical protein
VKGRTWAAKKLDARGFAHIIIIVGIIVIIVLAGFALVEVLNSPSDMNSSNSPNGSNNSTSNNNVTLLPGQASAQVIVTIHSTHSIFTVHYVLYLNSDQKAAGDLGAHDTIIKTITLVFPADQTGLYKVVILATSSGGGLGDKSDQAVVTPVSSGTYPVTLNI